MHRVRPLAAVALVAALALAACGGDDTDSDTSTVDTSAATVPASDAPAVTDAPVVTDAPAATDAPAETSAPETTEAVALGTIIDVATEAGTFTTLLAAVEAAGLTEAVATGKITLLAPTDDAFAALGQDAINALLADPAALTAVLQNHILPLPQDVDTIGLFSNVVTQGGGSLPVTADGDVVTVGGATITAADVMADNGIIQVIDTVLVPAA